MKFRIKLITSAVALSLLGVSPAFAAESEAQALRDLQKQTQLLQKQLSALQHQVKALKQNKNKAKRQVVAEQADVPDDHAYAAADSRRSGPLAGNVSQRRDNADITPPWIYTEGTPVVSAPYIGVHSQFDASDLIVNYSSINQDFRLLKQRQQLEDRVLGRGLTLPNHPLILLSGKIEGIVTGGESYMEAGTSDIDVGSGQLQVAAQMNPWVTGLMAIDYDSGYPFGNDSLRRISNSRFFLNKGFITVGNLNRFPMWFSVGQMFVPFGRYTSNMVSVPLTWRLGRTNSRALLIAYHEKDDTSPYAEVFGFKGDSRTNNKTRLNHFGTDFGYTYTGDKISADLGAGYINDMAEADGMQVTGGSIFGGFGAATQPSPVTPLVADSNELLFHRVSAANVHGRLTVGSVTLLGEWVTALSRFDSRNLMYNGMGARPRALNVEGSYSFPLWGRPFAISLGYGQSKESLALGIPSRRYAATLNTSIWQNTVLSLEFKHDRNNSLNDYASGTNSTVINAASSPILGQSANAVTAQFGLYF